jgi:hypothetical protein
LGYKCAYLGLIDERSAVIAQFIMDLNVAWFIDDQLFGYQALQGSDGFLLVNAALVCGMQDEALVTAKRQG